MFERYTEKARRTIFFARYEASHFGSHVIDTEHLLLGLLREDKRIFLMLGEGAANSIRAQIDAKVPKHESIPTSVDLPLSEPAKRLVKCAADEADRLNHRHIGCEHLFLALIREEDGLAREVLKPFAASLEQMRKKFEEEADTGTPPTNYFGPNVRGRLQSGTLRRETELVKIRDKYWDAGVIRDAVRRCCDCKWHWQKAEWKPRDLYVNRKSGSISLDASLAADAENFELLKAGWKKDHCAICRWELHESDDEHGTGYTNGRDWICTECYDKFWDRPNFISGAYSDLT
jgi:hypothetical protein